jgi:hypothetical protein
MNARNNKMAMAALAALTAAVAAACAPHAAHAQGQTLNPGQTITPGVAPSENFNPGTQLATLVSPFSMGSGNTYVSLSAQSAVYRNTEGTLDFYYQISNLSDSRSEITRFATADFGDLVTSVFFRTDPGAPFASGDLVATTIDRSDDGRIIGFNFDMANNQGVLLPGENSYTAVVRTSATDYQAGSLGVIGGFATTVNSFSPVLPSGGSTNVGGPTAIPEPGTFALAAPMLLGIAGVAMRRRRSQQA